MSATTENVAELFFARLRTTTNPGLTLAQFYSSLLGKEAGRSEIIKFNALIKIFGKTTVFFSIIDIARNDSITEFPYGLLFKICKDRLESSLEAEITSLSYENLERRITDAQKEILSVKKIDPSKVSKYLDDEDL